MLFQIINRPKKNMGYERYLAKLLNIRFRAFCVAAAILSIVLFCYTAISSLNESKTFNQSNQGNKGQVVSDDLNDIDLENDLEEIEFDQPKEKRMDQKEENESTANNDKLDIKVQNIYEDRPEENTWKNQRDDSITQITDNMLNVKKYDYDEENQEKILESVPLHIKLPNHTITNYLQYSYLINEPHFCFNKDIKILVMVHSLPKHREQRDLIRETWASVKNHIGWGVQTVFLLGHTENEALQDEINEESKMYHDMVQISIPYKSKTSSIKSVLGLKWILHHCKDITYIIKVDDSIFINIFHAVSFLQKIPETQKPDFIYCFVIKHHKPMREKGQFQVTYEEFPHKQYPPYCAKFAYVFSKELAVNIYKEIDKTIYFWLDDIFLTGIVMENLHLSHIKFTAPFTNDSISIEYDSERVNDVLFLESKYFVTRRTWNHIWNAARKYNGVN